MEALKILYKEATGKDIVAVETIPGAGSHRQYYRLKATDGTSLIGVIGTNIEENRAFCYLSRHFFDAGLPVPLIIAESKDGLRYLQSDLGNRSLFDALKYGREAGGQYDDQERELLRRTVALLPAIQIRGAIGLDFSQCYPQEALDETNVFFDLNYFKYCFLKPSGIEFHEMKLEEDFRRMAHDIVSIPGRAFMHRDCQARNVMLDAKGNPYFIDFQGGRRGPVQYDVASFLWQASARYSEALREELIDVYLEGAKKEGLRMGSEQEFRQGLRLCVLFRLLQVLGAYGFRGYFERKKYFIDSIPPAMDNLRKQLDEGNCPYPYLAEVLKELLSLFPSSPQIGAKRPASFNSAVKSESGTSLTVRVFSFSYKKGIPDDTSGNGGGYVFDCRGTNNPGRYDAYKRLTGLDEPVIRFLEEDGEILSFLESVYKLADTHVSRYMERGFTSLMFCFGCTGGQHRSVYCAQHLAEHIHNKFGIEVRLCHREQMIEQTFPNTRDTNC